MTPVRSFPFVMKKNFISVVIGGVPHSLNDSDPMFPKLKKALQEKEWSKVPKLVNMASTISEQSNGEVEIKKGKVFYKGREVKNSLAERMSKMVKEGKKIQHLMQFMNNLYLNPSEVARNEFYDWLTDAELPVTDSGDFLCYKSVDDNNKDQHTHSIDNSPGQVIIMPRAVADTDYGHQCSTGFHVCSKHYGLYGSKVMAVKVNPKYVLSAQGGKMRVSRYEVLKDLGTIHKDLFKLKGFEELEGKLVVEIKQERKDIIKKLLTIPDIKRRIRKKKLSKRTLLKTSYARLKTMFQKLVPEAAPARLGPENKQPLKSARLAAGLTIRQVAEAANLDYKTIGKLEMSGSSVEKEDKILMAIAKLSGSRNHAVTFPTAVKG